MDRRRVIVSTLIHTIVDVDLPDGLPEPEAIARSASAAQDWVGRWIDGSDPNPALRPRIEAYVQPSQVTADDDRLPAISIAG